MKKTSESIHVVDTLFIKQDPKSCKWHYDFRINGTQYRKSTKTDDCNIINQIYK